MKTVDVAIFGAGMAGLSAAYALRNHDIDFEVLEAEDYEGGRAKSQRLDHGLWVNLGAAYVSHDKTKVISFIDDLGVKTLSSELALVGDEGGDEIARWAQIHEVALTADDRRDIEAVLKRITREQLNPRPESDPELDDQSFGEWLGDVSPHTLLFFENVCHVIGACPARDMSLVGFLWAFGTQRSSPWMPKEYWETSGRGDLMIDGGTGEIPAALANAVGDRVKLNTKVLRAIPDGDAVRIELIGPDGPGELRAKSVISSLPAPLALDVIEGLPDWKRSALEKIEYGKFLAIGLAVNPSHVGKVEIPLTESRPEEPYNWLYGRPIRMTPGDIDQVGATFQSVVNPDAAVQIWDDSDESIKSGGVKLFQRMYPEYADRIAYVGIQRWSHAIPQMRLGRMKLQDEIVAPVAPFFFCGDYTWPLGHMDTAARSGERAVVQMLEAVG
jgi:predicted NAD/FAD-dependent oxidoreductase